MNKLSFIPKVIIRTNLKKYYGPLPYSLDVKYLDYQMWPHNFLKNEIDKFVEWKKSDL